MASSDGNSHQPAALTSSPATCTAGCGFFGSANTGGMCSKCYKETLAKSSSCSATAATSAAAPAPAPPVPAPSPTLPAPPPPTPTPPASTPPTPATKEEPPAIVAAVADDDAPDELPKKKQTNTSRCWTCNRKIGLLGFQCKCDYFFCAEHRYSDKHECAFDFKALGKKQLTAANPTIAFCKVASI